MEQVPQETIEKLRLKCRQSLFFLAYAVLGLDKLEPKIHMSICNALQDWRNNTRIAIILPRDWFKSSIASIAYPIWRSLNDPNIRVLIVQNSFSNACKKLQAIRTVFEQNQLFRALFCDLLPTALSTWKADCLTVSRGSATIAEGTFEAAGTGTAVTGRHYDIIIQDDTVAPDLDAMTGIMQQPTQMEIEKAIGWHRMAYPLLLHPAESQMVVVGTRWAVKDLLGYIIETSPEYLVISRAVRENIKGQAANKDEGGHAVWSRFSETILDQLERDMGPYMFAGLMMNRPTAAINQMFKRNWIQYYDKQPCGLIFAASVDMASAKKEESSDPDYSVVLTTGINPATGDVYVMQYTRDRMTPGELVEAIISHYDIYSPVVTKVESIGYQRTLVYWLQKRMAATNSHFYIEEIKSLKGSKEDRIRGLQPYFSAGKIYIKPDMSELERELLAFPKSPHDDLIDALSMHRDFWTVSSHEYRKAKHQLFQDPNTGLAVITELQNRHKAPKRYPYDIGNMKDRLVMKRRPSYVGSQS